jgi:acetylornithine/N-succinyldiaminopimelate aminotransferase
MTSPTTANSLADSILAEGQAVVMNTYKRFPLVLTSGQGCTVTDANGKQYLDFVAGIAVNTLGHAHPKLVAAIAKQAGDMMHCSNLYWTEGQVSLAKQLTQAGQMARAFFCNSGAEAVEAALKLARKHHCLKSSESPRTQIIAMQNSFHGRTYGALSATGQMKYHNGFAPLLPDITHVPFNDLDALKAVISDKTAAVILEPIQGEGGVQPADANYLKAVRDLCDARGVLLIFDEVQSGIGRTGNFFAWQHSGVQPDMLTLAKGLGGGFPIGAMLAAKSVADSFEPGDHASTFGGNPLACAAAQAVLSVIGEENLLQNVQQRGEELTAGLKQLQIKYSAQIREVRGMGLMQGIALDVPTAPIVSTCMEAGLLLVGAGADVIRFVPPLTVSSGDIQSALSILDEAFAKNPA